MSPTSRLDLETVVEQFERNWNVATTANLPQLISRYSGRLDVIRELILVDMEFRWKRQARSSQSPLSDALGSQPRLEDYILHIREFRTEHIVPSMVAEEYRVRQRSGGEAGHAHYERRFPKFEHLPELLRDVDRELQREYANSSVPLDSSFDARAPLPYSDFVLLEHLGTGGMGKVYQAKQASLDRNVAIKALVKTRQNDPLAVEQFLLEAKLLGQLQHPNIVGVHGVGRFPAGGFFIAMDFVNGGNLETHPFDCESTQAIIRCCQAITQAVQHAHQRGIVHCDLKPSNILMTKATVPLVADFGLASLLPTGEESSSLRGGTFAYLAPERLAEQSVIDPAVDVFGIGAILCFLLTGQPPRVGALGELVPIGNRVESNAPAELVAVCERCLRPNPADRFGDASEVFTALSQCADGQ